MSLCAVVPVKAFVAAKQRLQRCCTAAQRDTLARLMLQDVLDVLLAAGGLQDVLVVTGDGAAAALARRSGAAVLDEPAPGGLNVALTAAAEHLARRNCTGMLVVPGDVPGLTGAEVARLIAAHEGAGAAARRATLVPAHDRCGTNAMALSPPDALRPAFGPDSFAVHRRTAHNAGLHLRTLALPALGLDLDHPEDLARFARTPSATRTWRYLDALAPAGPATPIQRTCVPAPLP